MTMLIGDSIGLSIKDNLECQVYVDAVVGRQFSTGVDVVRDYKEAGELHRRMVIELGTNGPITQAKMDEMLTLLKGKRVWFVTNYVPGRDYQTDNNRLIHQVTRAYDNVKLIGWRYHALLHPWWFQTDPLHIHPNSTGQQFLADLVCKAISL